jgi:hypothetical protein
MADARTVRESKEPSLAHTMQDRFMKASFT